MKKTVISLAIAAFAICALMAKSAKDPVLMTVNGRPVYKSEFEYLYNKNAGQQIEHQSLDDYVEMFVNYKLKVADALANGYDSTDAFNTELSKYRAELAAPYMIDKEAENEILDEIYSHFKQLRKISHIMFPLQPDGTADMTVADSVRAEILKGNLAWNDAVETYSIDRGSKQNGGSMGWLVVGRFPADFEDMAYATGVGQISEPVNSGYGIHLIRVDESKPNPGEVKARHILKLTARKSPEEAAKAKNQIDSIYAVLMNGADFAEVARIESEDPGSKANGGELDWFGTGTMVAPFDSAAFSMAEGVISRPFQTSYGWHIVEVTGHRPMKSREEMDTDLRGIMFNSEKGFIPQQRFMQKIRKKYNARLIDSNIQTIREMLVNNPGGYDSVMVAKFSAMDMPVAQVMDVKIPLKNAMKNVAVTLSTDVDNAMAMITQAASTAADQQAREMARIDLVNSNAEYRNLINEYSDGILLFDISQDKVWQKASNDRPGLEAFFKKHKADYVFDEPRYKALIVFATNDSIENEVKKYLNSLAPSEINTAQLAKQIREKFGKNARAERVIAKKGENPITDYLGFGCEKPENKATTWSNYFAFRGEIIEQPVEADDVRSKVMTDYQNELEKLWIDEIRAKYPVKIDRKVLKTVKEIQPK